MSEITPELVAATPPTVGLVADLLTEADNDLHDGYDWKLHLSASDNVVQIGIEPFADDGTMLPELHYRAIIVEAVAHKVAFEPVELPAELARQFAYEDAGGTIDGWTVVVNEYVDKLRWESIHRLVIRNEAGEHFADTYRRGLTEYQDRAPYEYESTATFTPVVPTYKVVQEWAAPKGGRS